METNFSLDADPTRVAESIIPNVSMYTSPADRGRKGSGKGNGDGNGKVPPNPSVVLRRRRPAPPWVQGFFGWDVLRNPTTGQNTTD